MRGKLNGDRRWLVAAALIGMASGGVTAGEPPAAGAPTPAVAAPLPAAEAALGLLGASTPVSDEALGAESGKAQLQLDKLVVNDQDLNGVLQGNVATNSTNGDNTISGSSFTDSNGFVTAIQNTGNNTLIQNSTIINISMEP